MYTLLLYSFASLIVVTLQDNPGSSTTITLEPNAAKIITIPAQGVVRLQVKYITYQTAYIVCQVHAHSRNVTLSMEQFISVGTSVTGRDVGVVAVINAAWNWTWYLYSNLTSNHRALVHTTYLTGNEPLPGGCNEEFNLKNDPNIHLDVAPTKTNVRFQWSNTGRTPSGKLPVCEDSTYQSYLTYYSYVRYIGGGKYGEDAYFAAVKKMLMAPDVRKHGVKLTEVSNKPPTQSMYTISSYVRQGVVYNIVIKDHNAANGATAYAAYIPVVAYGCDIEDDGSCTNIDIAAVILATVGGIVGIFLAFLGHRYFKSENFIFGFLIFALIFYQMFALTTDISLAGILALATMLGLIGSSLLLGLWWYVGFPILNVLFIALVAGYLFSSILFYTSFANLTVWDSPFNYGMSFACATLLFPVFMLWFTRTLNIFCCAFIGSYGIVVAMDTYIGSGMRYLVLNSLRHGSEKDYEKVIVTGPFTEYEWILTILWVVLTTCGFTFQTIREHKKAPFPPCPRQLRNRSRDLRSFIRSYSPDREPLVREDILVVRQTMGDNSRQPLLRGDNVRRYGTQGAPVQGNFGDNEEVNQQTNRQRTV